MNDAVSTPSASPVNSEVSPSSSEKSAPSAPAEPRKLDWKLKVDGNDWSPVDEADAQRYAQIGKAKEKRFEDATKLRKEADTIKARIKDDPWGVLKEMGVDTRGLSEKHLLEFLEEETLSPEAKEKRDLQKKLKAYEEQEAKTKSDAEAAHNAAEVEKWAVKLDLEVSSALESSSIPKSPGSVRRVAKVLYDALEAGEDMTAAEAVEIVESEYQDDINQLLKMAKDPNRFLPEEIAKKLMDGHLAKVKGAPQASTTAAKSEPKASKGPKQMSSADFGKFLRNS